MTAPPMSFPEMYEQELVGPLFKPFAEVLVDTLAITSGDRVLDIACGTGIVARLAKDRVGSAGKVVGVDSNPGMLGVARTLVSDIDWREADAGKLPLADGEEFNVVCCQQGLQFFPDRPGAMREMHRALKNGGRLGVSTWRSDTELPLVLALRNAAEKHVGPINDRRHSFGDEHQLESLLQDAGFRHVRSRTVSQTIRFRNPSSFIRLNAMALVGMSAAAKSLSDDERGRKVAAIVEESGEAAKSYIDDTGLNFELATNMVTATR